MQKTYTLEEIEAELMIVDLGESWQRECRALAARLEAKRTLEQICKDTVESYTRLKPYSVCTVSK